ncbi:MAG: DUF2808 domain-containing protein [Pleurocapsa sp.]
MSLKIDLFSGITRKSSFIMASILAISVFTPSYITKVRAGDLENPSNIFLNSPRLIRTAPTNSAPNNPAKYHFTIEVPENAGTPLKAVTITQKPNLEQIEFDLSKSTAFLGNSFSGGEIVNLANNTGESPPDTNGVTIVFDQPIQPGNTVTVALKAKRNPFFGTIYLFGVEALPEGENSLALSLGSGRLRLSRN